MSTTKSSSWPKDEREEWGVLMLLETLRYLLNLPFIQHYYPEEYHGL